MFSRRCDHAVRGCWVRKRSPAEMHAFRRRCSGSEAHQKSCPAQASPSAVSATIPFDLARLSIAPRGHDKSGQSFSLALKAAFLASSCALRYDFRFSFGSSRSHRTLPDLGSRKERHRRALARRVHLAVFLLEDDSLRLSALNPILDDVLMLGRQRPAGPTAERFRPPYVDDAACDRLQIPEEHGRDAITDSSNSELIPAVGDRFVSHGYRCACAAYSSSSSSSASATITTSSASVMFSAAAIVRGVPTIGATAIRMS